MIFVEENNEYQIDVTQAIWATDSLNKIFHLAKTQLSDVDFIVETDKEIIFVEYKNSAIKNAVNPAAFNPLDDKKISQVAKKYYDSLTYVNAIDKLERKRKIYIYILEAKNGDSVLRGKAYTKLRKLLPFELQEQNNFKETLIDKFEVLSISEWNIAYPQFPLTKIL
ncbi:MAG: hypothetical protein ATN35_04815 [Epulopiscium sp. Nele67-Bin004]|nr:MAG: hypothetical protein ATN35_04815 [Epulopiscium sp. Nele67-Bin004]